MAVDPFDMQLVPSKTEPLPTSGVETLAPWTLLEAMVEILAVWLAWAVWE